MDARPSTPNIIEPKLLKQNQKGSKFVQLSTMQNYLPFSNYYKNGQKYTLSGSAYDKSNKNSVEIYAQGINYTDKALKRFIHQIDQIKKQLQLFGMGII